MSFDRRIARGGAVDDLYNAHARASRSRSVSQAPLIEEHLGPLRDSLGISQDHLMSLGRVHTSDPGEPFCMTVIGLKLSRTANAVSQLHGHISRRMWSKPVALSRRKQHPDRSHHEWCAHRELAWGQMAQFVRPPFSSQLAHAHGRSRRMQYIHNVDPGEMWETHNALKNLLLAFVRRRVSRSADVEGKRRRIEQARAF